MYRCYFDEEANREEMITKEDLYLNLITIKQQIKRVVDIIYNKDKFEERVGGSDLFYNSFEFITEFYFEFKFNLYTNVDIIFYIKNNNSKKLNEIISKKFLYDIILYQMCKKFNRFYKNIYKNEKKTSCYLINKCNLDNLIFEIEEKISIG